MSSVPYKPFARGYGIFAGIIALWAGWFVACWALWPVFLWIREALGFGGEAG
jgi:hypothetical protein